jgi:hypothetical protein
MRDFIESHWGDLIALLVLYTGIAMVVLFPSSHMGESLALAGMAALKLRPNTSNHRNNGSSQPPHATPGLDR